MPQKRDICTFEVSIVCDFHIELSFYVHKCETEFTFFSVNI